MQLSLTHVIYTSGLNNYGHSTNYCTYVVREVIDYYRNNGSDVFACTLDMQKAFDRVDISKLFNRPA